MDNTGKVLPLPMYFYYVIWAMSSEYYPSGIWVLWHGYAIFRSKFKGISPHPSLSKLFIIVNYYLAVGLSKNINIFKYILIISKYYNTLCPGRIVSTGAYGVLQYNTIRLQYDTGVVFNHIIWRTDSLAFRLWYSKRGSPHFGAYLVHVHDGMMPVHQLYWLWCHRFLEH